MTDEPIDRRPGTLLRDYAAFFRREGLAHPRLAELDALADALDAITSDDLFYLGEVLANFRAWTEAGAGDFLRPGFREYAAHAERAIAKLAALLPPEGT